MKMTGVQSPGEWRRYWPLTVAALAGYTALGLSMYAIGPFVPYLEQSFGWNRSEVMIGASLSQFVSIFLNVVVGLMIDRFGPRWVGLTGFALVSAGFALLATATGTLTNWALLWLLIGTGVVMVQPSIWSSTVAARFDKSRGVALAVVLSGAPLTATIAPVLATWAIAEFGWRMGFAMVGATWLMVGAPLIFLFFRNPRDGTRPDTTTPVVQADLPGLTLAEGLRTSVFWKLAIAFGTFSFYNMAMATNLVPLLSETGISAMQAAEIASIMGLFGIGARLGTGFLLDRFPGAIIGGIIQFLPVIGCGILLMHQPGIPSLMLSAAMFGIATGAEIDVSLYLGTRHFGLKAFGALFGVVMTAGSICSSGSPFIAGWLHDQTGNYDMMLQVVMVLMTIGAIAIGTTGRPADGQIDRVDA